MDCIFSELKDVEDLSLVQYVMESIVKQDVRKLYESFCIQEESFFDGEICDQDEEDTYSDLGYEEYNDTCLHRYTIRGQKEKEKEKQQQALYPDIENNTYIQRKPYAVKEIVKFWDKNGFGFSNVNAKQQLLSWLDDSSFFQPRDVILKAMSIACANNKRKLNYVVVS